MIRNYISNNQEIDPLSDGFDYGFNINKSKEEFRLEFRKFLGLYNCIFYHEKRFLTVINSLEIRLKEKDIEHIFKMFKYAEKHNLRQEKNVLCDFLYTYWKTIISDKYKSNYDKARESKNDFINILEKLGDRKSFFLDFQDMSFDFYKELLKYAIYEKSFIDNDLIERIFNNINNREEYCTEIVNLLVENDKNLYKVIEFDNNINDHVEHYYLYIIKSLDEFDHFNYAKEVFSKLINGNYIDDEKIKNILNKYIDIENSLCNNLKNKQYNFSTALYEINYLKNEYTYILNNTISLENDKKDKIHECLKKLLALKRYLFSDSSYVQAKMKEEKFSTTIKNELVEDLKKDMQANSQYLSIYSNVDFTSDMGKALESYSKYPLSSILTSYKINDEKGIYAVGVKANVTSTNNFKLYFDNIGQEYTKKHLNLRNKLAKDYYEELLKYLGNVFEIHQSLLNTYLELSKTKNEVFNELKKELKYDFDNDYAILVSNILAIETNIFKMLKKKGLNTNKSGFENINELFKYYKDNKNATNWLMYINYVLYEKSGMNLRNEAMHGNLINTDLSIPLIVSYTGLIFISRLLNEDK